MDPSNVPTPPNPMLEFDQASMSSGDFEQTIVFRPPQVDTRARSLHRAFWRDSFDQRGATREENRDPREFSSNSISWCCQECGYFMLAMDHRGRPLPLSAGPSGELLPVHCPKCDVEHTQWKMASPFDEFGDHANIAASFGVKSFQPVDTKCGPTASSPRGVNKMRGSRSYYCQRCNRRLLRMDSDGNVVPLEVDAIGRIAPLRCPGCNAEHRDWGVGPLFSRPTMSPVHHPVL